LLLDRTSYRGGAPMLAQPWGLAGRTANGTCIATDCGADQLARARALVAESRFSGLSGLTLLGDVLVCRALADRTREILELFASLWAALRPELLPGSASRPRIWTT
jgi:urease accessory protein